MLINNPSNPTGQVFPEATVDMIAKFCRQYSITLISDEIYSDTPLVTWASVAPAATIDSAHAP